MSVHRMDFLVGQHQTSLAREAAEERLCSEVRIPSHRRSDEAGMWRLPPVRLLLRVAAHDLATQRIHVHHVGGPHAARHAW